MTMLYEDNIDRCVDIGNGLLSNVLHTNRNFLVPTDRRKLNKSNVQGGMIHDLTESSLLCPDESFDFCRLEAAYCAGPPGVNGIA